MLSSPIPDAANPNFNSRGISNTQSIDPDRSGGVFYSKSRIPSTQRRTKSRKSKSRTTTTYSSSSSHSKTSGNTDIPDSVDQSYFDQRYGKDEHGRDLFRWNGKEYVSNFPGTRISKTKTVTKIGEEKISRFGTIDEHGNIHYKYTYPGSRVQTVYRNSTYESESLPGEVTRIHQSSKTFSSGGGSSSSSSINRYNNVGSSVNGEDTDIVYDYEEDEFDPEFDLGPEIPEEDKVHPFVLRGLAFAPGRRCSSP